MANYQRVKIEGATYFYIVNLWCENILSDSNHLITTCVIMLHCNGLIY